MAHLAGSGGGDSRMRCQSNETEWKLFFMFGRCVGRVVCVCVNGPRNRPYLRHIPCRAQCSHNACTHGEPYNTWHLNNKPFMVGLIQNAAHKTRLFLGFMQITRATGQNTRPTHTWAKIEGSKRNANRQRQKPPAHKVTSSVLGCSCHGCKQQTGKSGPKTETHLICIFILII